MIRLCVWKKLSFKAQSVYYLLVDGSLRSAVWCERLSENVWHETNCCFIHNLRHETKSQQHSRLCILLWLEHWPRHVCACNAEIIHNFTINMNQMLCVCVCVRWQWLAAISENCCLFQWWLLNNSIRLCAAEPIRFCRVLEAFTYQVGWIQTAAIACMAFCFIQG